MTGNNAVDPEEGLTRTAFLHVFHYLTLDLPRTRTERAQLRRALLQIVAQIERIDGLKPTRPPEEGDLLPRRIP